MEVFKNSIWYIKEFDGLDSGLYRVLHIFDDIGCLILFPLLSECTLTRPTSALLDRFILGISNKKVLVGEFELPPYLLVNEEEVSKNHLIKRDKNYKLIEDLANDLKFLFDYSTNNRVARLAQYVKEKETYYNKIIRLLNIFWRYGQHKGVLLPAYQNSGGEGKERKAKDKPLGAGKNSRTLAMKRSKTFILTDMDKNNIRKSVKKHHLKPHGKDLKETHQELLRTYYADEVIRAKSLGESPYVPSYKQLRYWKKRLFSEKELLKNKTTERDYLLNKRGFLGSATKKWSVPGSCFEIDATVADVHIVSSLGSQYVLGRLLGKLLQMHFCLNLSIAKSLVLILLILTGQLIISLLD